MVYSPAKRVFIQEHYIAPKSFAAVREAFSNAFSNKEVHNKTTVHRILTTFRDTGSIYNRKHIWCLPDSVDK
jgi:hypothetical protein